MSTNKGIWFKLEEPASLIATRGIPKKGDAIRVMYIDPFLPKGLAQRVSTFTNEDIKAQSVVELGITELLTAL